MLDRENPKTLIGMAQKAFSNRRHARACVLYEKIPLYSREAETCFQLGQAYSMRNRHDQALKSLRQALDKGYDSAAVHHAIGKIALTKGDVENALHEFEASISADPKHEAGLLAAGQVHEGRGEYEKAMDFFERACALPGATIETQLYMARVLDALGQHAKMLDVLKKTIVREPGNEVSFHLLSDLLPKLAEREMEAAIVSVTEILTRTNNRDALLRWIETLAQRKESIPWAANLFIDEAKALWSRYQPDEAKGLYVESRLGEIVQRIGYREDLALRIQSVLADLSLPVPHAYWGEACIASGRMDDGLEQFRFALQRDTDGEHVGFVANLFNLTLAGGVNSEALDKLEKLFGSPGEVSALLGWAEFHYFLGKHEEALAILNTVSDQTGGPSLSGRLHRLRVDLLKASGKPGEAIPDLLKVLRYRSHDSLAWWELTGELAAVERPEHWSSEIKELLESSSDAAMLVEGARAFSFTASPGSVIPYLEKAIQIDSSRSETYEYLAELLPKLDKPQGVAVVGRMSTLVRQTNKGVACRNWGGILEKLDRVDEAVTFLEEARTLDPEDHEALLLLARLHRNGKRFDQAFDLHVRAAEVRPEEPGVYTSWAESLVEQEKSAGVTAKLATALGGTDVPAAGTVNWEEIRETRDIQLKAIERLVSAIECWCDHASPCVTCGVDLETKFAAYARTAGERLFKSAAFLDQKHFWAAFDVSVTQGARMQYRKAQESLVQARGLARIPDEQFKAQVQYAWYLAKTQKFAEADRAYAEACDIGTEEEPGARAAVYNDWALVLSQMKEFDRALATSLSALSLSPKDYWSHFRRAYTLSEMSEYDSSVSSYETAITIDPNQPYARHNIAHVLERQGFYARAREKWKDAAKFYQAGLAKALQDHDMNYCSFYGAVLAGRLQDLDRAESLFRAAELLNPCSADLQQSLLSLYQEKTKKAKSAATAKNHKPEKQPEVRQALHWRAQNAYLRARKLLEERLLDDRDSQTLLELGALELLKGEYESAASALKEAIDKNPMSALAHQKLGETFLAQGRPAKAVASLTRALFFRPDDLALRTAVGRAHLRAGNLDEAESELVRVTDAARFHVDAWLALGEVYVEVAESKAAKDTARMDEWYDRAIEAFARGIDIAKSPERPTNITAEMDNAHYLLGYAQIQLYESAGLRRDVGMVRQARNAFIKCIDMNPGHTKARRALQRMKEQRSLGRTIAERSGPYLLIFLSFVLVGISMLGLFNGIIFKDAGFALTQSSIEALKDLGIKPDQVDQLKRHTAGARFPTEDKLMGKVKEVLGAEMPEKTTTAVRQRIINLSAEWQRFTVAEFAMLFFGGLLFLIASVYLPQLTSLKLPGLQLDKSASERVEPIRTIGISK